MKLFVPGKLMICGEWCVLEKGLPCIVMAVDAGITVEITKAHQYSFAAPDLNISDINFSYSEEKVKWTSGLTQIQKAQLLLCRNAIEITLNYLQNKEINLYPFHIKTSSKHTIIEQDNGKSHKIGLGSSAAIAVGVVSSILQFHDFDVHSRTIRKIIFKIAYLAHYHAQEKLGSGFDIAASVWGGLIYYKRVYPDWLAAKISENKLVDLVDQQWEGLHRANLVFPKDAQILVGFVGYSANTKKLIMGMNSFKKDFLEKYQEAMMQIAEIVEELKQAFLDKNMHSILQLVKENRYRLGKLNNFSHKKIETKELALLADIAEKNGAAGKFSGAGGGDCGIAIVSNKAQKESILRLWKENNITPIPLNRNVNGVSVLESSKA